MWIHNTCGNTEMYFVFSFILFSKYCFSGLVVGVLLYLAYLIMVSHTLITILYLGR